MESNVVAETVMYSSQRSSAHACQITVDLAYPEIRSNSGQCTTKAVVDPWAPIADGS